jgi:Na+-driven multidrug efflux pump
MFSAEPEVIAAGVDYLRTISWGYVASGVIFVSAGVFQGLGNTWPSLLASLLRALIFVGPLLVLSKRPGFTLHHIWLAGLVTVFLQLGLQQALLRRELRLKAAT